MYGDDPWTGRTQFREPVGRHAEHRPTSQEVGLSLPPMPEWMDEGLCSQTDPEAFFPEKGGSTKSAKRVCMSCDVRSQCLEYAFDHDERFGIWGGLSERERRKLKKARAAGEAA